MDIGTLIGLLIAFGMVIGSMLVGAGVGPYLDFPSFLITVGGTVGIIMAGMPINKMVAGVKAMTRAFVSSSSSAQTLIEQLVDFAIKARRDGILSLESEEENMEDDFLKKGIRLAVDGTEPDVIRVILEKELESMAERHEQSAGMLSFLEDMGPAMGMIGTLIGLVAMLLNLSDPTAVGPAMSVALITTMYGSVMANMIAKPLIVKLAARSVEEQQLKTIMLAGIMAIQAGDNPRIVEQKLNVFLEPKLRKSQFD